MVKLTCSILFDLFSGFTMCKDPYALCTQILREKVQYIAPIIPQRPQQKVRLDPYEIDIKYVHNVSKAIWSTIPNLPQMGGINHQHMDALFSKHELDIIGC